MNSIQSICAAHSTPFYLYDGACIAQQADILKTTFPDFSILFSVKANPFPPVLKKMASLGIGADAASAAEVDLALSASIPADLIYYSAPAPTQADIRQIWGKCHIIADSFHALSLLECEAAAAGEELSVGLRLHPNFTMDGKPQTASKFGIDEDQLWAKTDFRTAYPHLRVIGLHTHIRSQVLDATLLGKYYKNVMDLAVRLQDFFGAPLDYINFGGGVGLPYDTAKQSPLDFDALRQAVSAAREIYADRLPARLLLESGRFLTCSCGTYVTEIVDIKVSHGRTYYVVKNGANGFLKPVLRRMLEGLLPDMDGVACEPFVTEDDDYSIRVLSDSTETERVDIAGHLCTAADVMARDIVVNKAKIGDLVTFSNAGSYAYSLAPLLFASQPKPEQVFVDRT